MPALAAGGAECNLVLFPVDSPSVFDAVICDDLGYVQEVQVKKEDAASNWIWGAVTIQGEAFHQLKLVWESRHRTDKYLGELLNASIAAGNPVQGRFSGESYIDVGTMEGYRTAQDYLRAKARSLRVA
jgi:dTDP-glucose pyrophosphorylase